MRLFSSHLPLLLPSLYTFAIQLELPTAHKNQDAPLYDRLGLRRWRRHGGGFACCCSCFGGKSLTADGLACVARMISRFHVANQILDCGHFFAESVFLALGEGGLDRGDGISRHPKCRGDGRYCHPNLGVDEDTPLRWLHGL